VQKSIAHTYSSIHQLNKLNVDQPRKKAEAEKRDYLSSERKSKARAPEKVVVHIKSDLNTKCKSKATPLKSIKKKSRPESDR